MQVGLNVARRVLVQAAGATALAWALLMAALYVSIWPNAIHFYATYNTTAALDLGAEPIALSGDVAWFVRPSAPERHMVVMVHGRSGNMAQVVPLARTLVAAGHGVLLFDMPRAGLPPFSAPTRWRLWGAMVDDRLARRAIVDAVNLARALGNAPVALYGHSLGGTFALQAASLACVDVVISDGSPFSLVHAALSHVLPSRPIDLAPPAAFWPAHGWPLGGLFELEHREVWAFTLPTDSACTRAPRWLGLHSAHDEVVPVSHLEQLRKRSAGAWRAAQTLDVGGRHWEPDRPERARAVLDVLSTANDAPAPSE